MKMKENGRPGPDQKLITAVAAQELAFGLLSPEEQEILRRGDAIVRVAGNVDESTLSTVEGIVPGYLSVIQKITMLQDGVYRDMLGQKLS